MKNINYSTILFSIFSPDIILSRKANPIKPLMNSFYKTINIQESQKQEKSSTKKLMNKKKFIKIPIQERMSILNKMERVKSSCNRIPKIYQLSNGVKPIIIEKSGKNRKYAKRIRTKRLSANKNPFSQRITIEPYKQYLINKSKLEYNRNRRENKIKYIEEYQRKKKLEMQDFIRNKFNGLDFSKQKPRESFIENYIRSKQYNQRSNSWLKFDSDDIFGQIGGDHLVRKVDFETKQKKYIFLGNKTIIPFIKYKNFNEKYNGFKSDLKENPSLRNLIGYK